MKKIFLLIAIATASTSIAQIKMPAPSPTQTITQEFGLGKIELSYSRPSIKGRELFKEGSELAPLNNVWRTGANSATTLKFTDEVMIGGTTLKSGKYGLLTIPGKKEWIVIISKDTTVNQASSYKIENDVVRVTIEPVKLKENVEMFTMQFANIAAETCELHMTWGSVQVAVPISTNIKDRVRAQVEKALAADAVQANTYNTAANFYYEFDKDYNKALVNITKAVEGNKEAYWMLLLKARIEKALGDKVSAKASAQKCIDIATGKNADYVTFANELIKSL